jgi:hypothetical protein
MWKPIKIKGLFIKLSKSGKVLKCTVTDINEMAESIKEQLTKRPTWKQNHSDNEREFMITLKGSIGEIWDDAEAPPPEPKKEEDFDGF